MGRDRDRAGERDRIAGCLLGGAIGDALGAGIEFLSLAEIRRRYGPAGVTGLTPAYGRVGAITDDTQMTLFTTEGLIRGNVRGRSKGITDYRATVRHAYMRWLFTQGYRWPPPGPPDVSGTPGPDGWLVAVEGLHDRRAPGNTCLSGMRERRLGTTSEPLNDSKGCGGVMRAAPCGFLAWSDGERFRLGCDIAALTHGHPSGYLPAGVLATVVGRLVDGGDLEDGLDAACALLVEWPDHAETLEAIEAGRRVGALDEPTPEEIETLGGGWVGEEALAIAVACVLSAPGDARRALLAAVNHSGDSDSTGSIAGNLFGAMHGTTALPAEWLSELELRDVIARLAGDASTELRENPPGDDWGAATTAWFERYPGW